MSNRIRYRRPPNTQRSVDSVQSREPKVSYWPFWRIVYWLVVFLVILGVCLALFYTLQSDRGHCDSYDVRCE
ncbi:uncharacterized protein LOC111065137 [Drosophila obscura]|uniref:uncharacterized protein LOC111065137 n=1 Tax=Drosophila obscura TaxID=7282 RepID=UPI001BB0E449|nr:uncharacterized protein LOC111065137 [Drosophila obscura]